MSKVVEYAGLNEKIESLEKGIDSNLLKNVHEDGIELSGGETQKLLLARALYRDAPFLVLDEPTAALDSIAEMELYNKYNELTKDSTSIFISHRMASTRFCDYILLIKDKKILEKGTHDQLMKFGGEYRRIFDIQSKYYKEDVNEA
ncbi:ATP-binding cassette domain-containing protein [Helcococcus kunzii]|nr:ATP-binding cassette domain-containing protein [Helcococcus kunzii]